MGLWIVSDSGFSARFSEIVDGLGGQNAAARVIGMAQGGVHRLIKGGEPSLSTLRLIAEKTGQSLLWLATGQRDVNEAVLIPLRDVQASAGAGTEVGDEVSRDYLVFSRSSVTNWGRSTALVEAIRARGDSMEPTIQDGAIVLIDRAETTLTEGRIFAFRTPDGLRLKRFQRAIDGTVMLVSDNRELYTAERINLSDLQAFEVAGRAFWTERLI